LAQLPTSLPAKLGAGSGPALGENSGFLGLPQGSPCPQPRRGVSVERGGAAVTGGPGGDRCAPERVKPPPVLPGEFHFSSPHFLLRQLGRMNPPSPPASPWLCPPSSKLWGLWLRARPEQSWVCGSPRRDAKLAGEVFTALQCAGLPPFPVSVNRTPNWFMEGGGITKRIPSSLLQCERCDQENHLFVVQKKYTHIYIFWACLIAAVVEQLSEHVERGDKALWRRRSPRAGCPLRFVPRWAGGHRWRGGRLGWRCSPALGVLGGFGPSSPSERPEGWSARGRCRAWGLPWDSGVLAVFSERVSSVDRPCKLLCVALSLSEWVRGCGWA